LGKSTKESDMQLLFYLSFDRHDYYCREHNFLPYKQHRLEKKFIDLNSEINFRGCQHGE